MNVLMMIISTDFPWQPPSNLSGAWIRLQPDLREREGEHCHPEPGSRLGAVTFCYAVLASRSCNRLELSSPALNINFPQLVSWTALLYHRFKNASPPQVTHVRNLHISITWIPMTWSRNCDQKIISGLVFFWVVLQQGYILSEWFHNWEGYHNIVACQASYLCAA